MKNKPLTYMVLIGVVETMALASTIISSIVYDSFAYFEVFYLLCLALSMCVLFMAKKIKGHIVASIILFNLGFFVNCFIWSIMLVEGTGFALNMVLTVLIFISGLVFTHAYFNAMNARKISFLTSIVLAIMIIVVAVFNVVTKLSDELSTELIVTIIIQNLSLLSTLALPLMHSMFLMPDENGKQINNFSGNHQ